MTGTVRRSLSLDRRRRVAAAGRDLSVARAAMVLLHGRGATAEDILGLADELRHPDFAYLAPQAESRTWYPRSFLADLEDNEPELSASLQVVADVVRGIEERGLAPERIILLGFSQGACLALEFSARHARRFGGVVGLTGGLIGPPGTPRDYAGSLSGTPVFLGAGDPDPHVPWSRVRETAEALTSLGARVTVQRYPGLGHSIHRDELQKVRRLMRQLTEAETAPRSIGSAEPGATRPR